MAVTPDWILLPKYYLPTTGGLQTFTNRLAQQLEARGRAVSVITKRPAKGRPVLMEGNIPLAEQHTEELPAETFWDGVTARVARTPPGRRVMAIGLEYEEQLDRQLNALVQIKEDLGHRVALKVATTFDLAERLTRHRAALLNRLDAVFVLNSQMQSEAQEYGLTEPRLAMLPPLIDLSDFAPAGTHERASLREAFGLPKDGFVALWTGRLCSRKQIDQTITAWSQANVPGVLWLVGDDEESGRPAERELTRAAEALGMGVPLFQPSLPPHAMSNAYKAADLFISTSRVEGMSNSMLEALAVGLPIVAYDIPGNTDLYGQVHSPGWHLVDTGDVAAIAEGIRTQSRHPSDQMTLRATRETSLARFSWGNVSRILQGALGTV